MKVLICGDRFWVSREAIYLRLSQFPKDTLIIEGACSGADQLAGSVARELGMKVVEFPAEWGRLGRRAGPIRNRQMLDEKPDLVIAFHLNLAESRGTKDTVTEATKRGIRVELVGSV